MLGHSAQKSVAIRSGRDACTNTQATMGDEPTLGQAGVMAHLVPSGLLSELIGTARTKDATINTIRQTDFSGTQSLQALESVSTQTDACALVDAHLSEILLRLQRALMGSDMQAMAELEQINPVGANLLKFQALENARRNGTTMEAETAAVLNEVRTALANFEIGAGLLLQACAAAMSAVQQQVDALSPAQQAVVLQAVDAVQEQSLKVQVIHGALTETVDRVFKRYGKDLPADEAGELRRKGLDAMEKAAVVLVEHGIDTPEKLKEFLGAAGRHDANVQAFCASLGQIGYGAGMSVMNYCAAPEFADKYMSQGLRQAFEFGSIIGAVVGFLDSLAGAAADHLGASLSYEKSSFNNAAAERLGPSGLKRLAIGTGVGAGTTLLKNLLLRVGALTLVLYLAHGSKAIPASRRDMGDLAADGGGAFVAAAAARSITRGLTADRDLRSFRMLSNDKLADVVERAQRSGNAADVANALWTYCKGLGHGATSLGTYAVTGFVITPLVGLLIMLNTKVIPKALSDAAGAAVTSAASTSTSTPGALASGATTVAAKAPDVIRLNVHAAKAAVSSGLMSVLGTLAPPVGATASMVQKGIADGFRTMTESICNLPGPFRRAPGEKRSSH